MRNQRLEAEAPRIQTNIDNLLSTIFQEPIARVNNSVAISRVLDTANGTYRSGTSNAASRKARARSADRARAQIS